MMINLIYTGCVKPFIYFSFEYLFIFSY